MSEPSSLFVKLKMKKENLERFLAAEITSPILDEDWTSWWDSREMYSKSPLERLPSENEDTNGEVLASYIATPETISVEKQEGDTYYFVSGFFGQNYYEVLPMLALLKSVALYMEPGDEGAAFIYDYFWGGSAVMAHLELSAGRAELKHTKETAKISKSLVAEADKILQDIMDDISNKYKD